LSDSFLVELSSTSLYTLRDAPAFQAADLPLSLPRALPWAVAI